MEIEDKDKIYKLLTELGDEFVVINNPGYIYSKFDICPVASKTTKNPDHLVAVVQDMDGTTTTTENLCLHSLETMVRQFTGLLTNEQWEGLDREKDYPHIIGNSTTKHVEYLIRTYQSKFNVQNFRRAYLRAALLTLNTGKDETRKREVEHTLAHFACGNIVHEKAVSEWIQAGTGDEAIFQTEEMKSLIHGYAQRIRFNNEISQVRAGIDIYYQRYHEILAKIEAGQGDELKALLPDQNLNLIEPMPGMAIFFAAIKGWLGKDLSLFSKQLTNLLRINSHLDSAESQLANSQQKLKAIGKYFENNPLKIAIATSSIAYEAKIVLAEVFKILKQQVSEWEVSKDKKNFLIKKFSDYHHVFDAIITASDSSEIRLKPHRDLYSLALHQLGIAKENYDKVVGFEDSEPGLISIRAAGIGLCAAVPFADTQDHNLSYASHILKGGLPEALLLHNAFLSDKALAAY